MISAIQKCFSPSPVDFIININRFLFDIWWIRTSLKPMSNFRFLNKILLYFWPYSFWSWYFWRCRNCRIVLLSQAKNLVDFTILLSAYMLDNTIINLPLIQLYSLTPLLNRHQYRLGTRLPSLLKLPFFGLSLSLMNLNIKRAVFSDLGGNRFFSIDFLSQVIILIKCNAGFRFTIWILKNMRRFRIYYITFVMKITRSWDQTTDFRFFRRF